MTSEFKCLEEQGQNSNVYKDNITSSKFQRKRPEFHCLKGQRQNSNFIKKGQNFNVYKKRARIQMFEEWDRIPMFKRIGPKFLYLKRKGQNSEVL